MKSNQIVGAVVFLIAGLLAYRGYGVGAAVVLVVPFMAAAAAAFSIRDMVVEHCQCSQDIGNKIAATIVESLAGPDEGMTLPSMVTEGKGTLVLRELYKHPQFQKVSQFVKTLGPVPCYPVCMWLSR